MKNRLILLIALILLFNNAIADTIIPGPDKPAGGSLTFIPQVMLQSWATYSMNEEKTGTDLANRFDTHFRRLRFGGKGEVYPGVKYNLLFHYDRIDEDPYAATKGSDNGFGLWHAYITAKLLKSSDLLYLNAGYYVAAISREYSLSSWTVASLDKSYAVWYLRKFLTAQGNGIESGAGFGGQMAIKDNFGFNYRLNVHTPEKHLSPDYANPLVTTRVSFSTGDPELKKYRMSLPGQYWQKRNGLSLGLGAAYQGKTDNALSSGHIFFDHSTAYGADLAAHYGPWAFDSEYFLMKRTADGYDAYQGREWHVRLSHIFLINNTYLEPAVMVANYTGWGASALYNHIGDDITYDIGLNWYLKKDKFKLGLHYIMQEGSVSSNQGDYLTTSLQIKL